MEEWMIVSTALILAVIFLILVFQFIKRSTAQKNLPSATVDSTQDKLPQTPSVQSTQATTKSTQVSTKPVTSTSTKPATASTKSASPTVKPAPASAKPATSTVTPAPASAKPATSTVTPAPASAKSATSTVKSAPASTKSVSPTVKPTPVSTKSVTQTTTKPSQTTKQKQIVHNLPDETIKPQLDQIESEQTTSEKYCSSEKGAIGTKTISMDKADYFSEYLVYKQFGYRDQAANYLNLHLSTLDKRPHDLLIELCGLYLESSDVDSLVNVLDQYAEDFSKPELEVLVKTAFEAQPDNLDLCVFAEQKLDWSIENIAEMFKETA
ncbi:MAG: hypothetical protein IK065_01525 [Neisseriaceae bacterium]|nr:hypothetical protein [Neisseriaceae bacterium]